MDLIYTNASRNDIGVLKNFKLDFEISAVPDVNTFEIEQNVGQGLTMTSGYYWYVEGEEYGGRVKDRKLDTKNGVVTYQGLTWRGILNTKVIVPDVGKDYWTPTGDLSNVLEQAIQRAGLTDLFKVAKSTTYNVTNFRWPLYSTLYEGLIYLLSKYSCKLVCRWNEGQVELSVEKAVDYTSKEEISSDLFDFIIKKTSGAPNHIIALGKGELKDRLVVHRYIGPDGKPTSVQHYFGLDEITKTYELNTIDDVTELTTSADEKLEEWQVEDSLEITANDIDADIGDIFTATTEKLNVSIKQYVTGKIVDMTDDSLLISYLVGDTMY